MKPEPTKEQTLNVVHALEQSHGTTLQILRDALSDADRRTALLALQTELKQLELTAKLTGQLNASPQLNFLISPEFVKLKQIITTQLTPFPEARLALSEALDTLVQEGTDDG
ncbi:MAG: hypothetical protein ACXV3D_00275 [Halobacteriota archaeon]